MTSRQRALRAIERISLALGVLCLGAYSVSKGEAWRFALRQEARPGIGSGGERGHPADSPPPNPGEGLRRIAVSQEAWGRIEVPRLSLREFVAEGVDRKTLRLAVGHIPETAFPDEIGNVALAGHRDSVFRPLRELVVGDIVTLSTPRGVFEYVVESIVVVDPSRVDLIAHRTDQVLTLVTCYPFDFLGPAPLRLVARGRLTRHRPSEHIRGETTPAGSAFVAHRLSNP